MVAQTSAFDLLDGAYLRQTRSRTFTVAVACGAALLGAANVFASVNERDRAAERIDGVVGQRTALPAEIGELAGGAGLPEQQIVGCGANRRPAVVVALNREPEVFGLLATVAAAAPAGVNVTGMTFDGGPVGSDGVTVTAVASSLGLLIEWDEALLGTGLFSAVATEWSGGGGAVSVATAGTLTDAARGDRTDTVLATLTGPPAPTEPEPADPTATDPDPDPATPDPPPDPADPDSPPAAEPSGPSDPDGQPGRRDPGDGGVLGGLGGQEGP